jgi:hypothetical protein
VELPQGATGGAQSLDFRVRGGIVRRGDPVPALGKDAAIPDHDRSERATVTALNVFPRQVERAPQEMKIGIAPMLFG